MYQVSDECRKALDSQGRVTDFYCNVTFSDGSTRQIDSSVIKSNSVYRKTRCVSGSDFELGAVCVGEFGMSLLGDSLDSRNYEGAVLKPYCRVILSESAYEDIPMGVFNVSEISTPDSRTTKLVCYDNMIKFDAEFYSLVSDKNEIYKATLPGWVGKLCEKCGVKLSEETILNYRNMANNNEFFMIYNGAAPRGIDIENLTCRDMLIYITQLLCGCAIINRYGKLEIINFDRRYSQQYPDYAKSIGLSQRKSTNIKNQKKVDAMGVMTIDKEGNERIVKYPPEALYSSLLVLDHNVFFGPFMNYETIEKYLEDIYNRLQYLTYYGAETEIFSDPTIDAGDHLLLTGGTAGQGVRILVTKNDWTYRGSHKITSDASVIQAKSSKNTASSGGSSGGSGSTVYAAMQKQYIYKLPPVFITTSRKRLCTIKLTPKDFTSPVEISGQITVEMIQSGTVTISSNVNGNDTGIVTQQHLTKGKHTLEINLPYNTSEIKLYTFDLYIACSHGHGESITGNMKYADAHVEVRGYFDEPEFESYSSCITHITFKDIIYAGIPVLDSESTLTGTIDWGDGTIEEYSPASPYNHTYTEQGDYNVAVDCYIESFKCAAGAESIILAESIRQIGTGAFTGSSDLLYVYIPPRVKVIGENAFSDAAFESVKIAYDCGYKASSFPEVCSIKFYPYESELVYADKHSAVKQTASKVWVILHNLNKKPSVNVIDNYGDVVWCDIEYTNDNTVTLRFSEETAGTVYLN